MQLGKNNFSLYINPENSYFDIYCKTAQAIIAPRLKKLLDSLTDQQLNDLIHCHKNPGLI